MKRLGVGQATLLAALIILLILTAVWAASVWNATDDAVMDKHGWIALGLGTFFSLFTMRFDGADVLQQPQRP